MATGFVNGRGQFLTPTESTPLDQSPKNWLLVVTSATPTSMPNLVQIRPWGASGRMDEIWQKIIYFFIPFLGNSPTGQARWQIFTLDGSNDANSCKDVPFGVSRYCSPFWGCNTPKIQFLGAWIGVFKPNVQNIESFMLSKLLHRFQPNFALWVVIVGGPNHAQWIQNGRRPPFWKKNR